ncbi:MAG TPA: SRPBCC domain-containing protein [Candidatus Limnocylindrales bacterium]
MTTETRTESGSIERTLDLHVAPDRVWAALTVPAEISGWFGAAASFEPEIGTDGWFDFGADGRFACRIEAVDPGRYLAWRWAEEPGASVDGSPGSLVEWWLEPGRKGGTRLRMRESGLRTPRNVEMNTHGWFEELAELREHLATEPWQVPIRRTIAVRADRDRVWRAFADPGQFHAWWGFSAPVELRTGWEGWFDFPAHGRHAFRIEAAEPPRYLAWTWASDESDVALEDAAQPTLVEWSLVPRADGGTDVHVAETGFTGPIAHADNTGGWAEMLPALAKAVESRPVEAGSVERQTSESQAVED